MSKPTRDQVDAVLLETNAALANLTKSIESMKKMLEEGFTAAPTPTHPDEHSG